MTARGIISFGGQANFLCLSLEMSLGILDMLITHFPHFPLTALYPFDYKSGLAVPLGTKYFWYDS